MTTSSPHLHGARSVDEIMRQVAYALGPALLLYVALFGFGVLVQFLVCVLTAIACEYAALRWRDAPTAQGLSDGSVVVLALLLCLAMPPYAPWWVSLSATAFAVLLGKHAFGGLGHNVFNPAMVGYLFVLLCFPRELATWPGFADAWFSPDPWTSIKIVFGSGEAPLDGSTGATVLEFVKSQTALMRMHSEFQTNPIIGGVAGARWEWLSLAYLSGGLYLLWRRIISWRLPLSFLLGLGLAAGCGYMSDAELHRGMLFHWFAGGSMLAAFFIVTDPVSSATTPKGMLVFGFATGVLTYLVREFGAYPDGVAFAVVTMNAIAPLIDRLSQPRLHGQIRKSH